MGRRERLHFRPGRLTQMRKRAAGGEKSGEGAALGEMIVFALNARCGIKGGFLFDLLSLGRIGADI